LRISIIGCGLIGNKRAEAAVKCGLEIESCFDTDLTRAEELAARYGGKGVKNLEEIFSSDSEIVNIAVTHDRLPKLALTALASGKHVLLEKPGARTRSELLEVAKEAEKRDLKVKVGYNHRFHPSLVKARELTEKGALGEILYIRGRYGHGGRPGYEKEWRMDPAISGGGELLDQGSHLIDLSLSFIGDLELFSGHLPSYYWKAGVEDNAFILLKSPNGACAQLHATWTEWKNLFSFEITGRLGKIDIQGLGGSYGTEQLAFYRMLPEMGPPETIIHQYPFPDRSFELEILELVSAARSNRQPEGGIQDALKVLKITDGLYGVKEEKKS
jgi:predicted dehydrogenase